MRAVLSSIRVRVNKEKWSGKERLNSIQKNQSQVRGVDHIRKIDKNVEVVINVLMRRLELKKSALTGVSPFLPTWGACHNHRTICLYAYRSSVQV